MNRHTVPVIETVGYVEPWVGVGVAPFQPTATCPNGAVLCLYHTSNAPVSYLNPAMGIRSYLCGECYTAIKRGVYTVPFSKVQQVFFLFLLLWLRQWFACCGTTQHLLDTTRTAHLLYEGIGAIHSVAELQVEMPPARCHQPLPPTTTTKNCLECRIYPC